MEWPASGKQWPASRVQGLSYTHRHSYRACGGGADTERWQACFSIMFSIMHCLEAEASGRTTRVGNNFFPVGHIDLDKISKAPQIGPFITANWDVSNWPLAKGLLCFKLMHVVNKSGLRWAMKRKSPLLFIVLLPSVLYPYNKVASWI